VQVTPAIVPSVNQPTWDFNLMWNKAKEASAEWQLWDAVTELNKKAYAVSLCKKDYPNYKQNIVDAEN